MSQRFKVQQIADSYGVSTGTIRTWINTGVEGIKLKAFKIGRSLFIAEEDLKVFERHFKKKKKKGE